LDYRLPLADSITLATARAFSALFWTQDSHFEKMDGVQYGAAHR
jgi:predicted nucleic acid-binding protein